MQSIFFSQISLCCSECILVHLKAQRVFQVCFSHFLLMDLSACNQNSTTLDFGRAKEEFSSVGLWRSEVDIWTTQKRKHNNPSGCSDSTPRSMLTALNSQKALERGGVVLGETVGSALDGRTDTKMIAILFLCKSKNFARHR